MLKHWEHTEIITKEQYKEFTQLNMSIRTNTPLYPNTAVFIQCEDGSKRLEGIYDDSLKAIRSLKSTNNENKDLRLYEDALNNENITVMAVDGLMGVGKTSTVMEHLIDKHLSQVDIKPFEAEQLKHQHIEGHKIVISKPAVNAGGEEYGFLPGDVDEKISPTIKNYTQYFDRLHPSGFELLNIAGYVEILPLGFVRGFDALDTTIVVDECQNTKELVTMVSRRAKGCNIVLLGDTSPFQIDLKGNTTTSNGLSHIMDLLQGAPYFQYIEMKSLEHVVRSGEVRDLVRRLFRKYGEDINHWTV